MLPRSCSGELYEVLELDSHCTVAEVSQQYRRLALRYHPDRNAGTTVEQFQRIEEAHRVLSDPQQRQLYDTVGRDGLKQLGEYSGGMVGSLLLAVGNVAAGCLLIGLLSTALFISLMISCYKIDAPRRWPSWGVVLLPLWFLLPMLVVASLAVMVASVQRGLYVLLLPSVRLLLCVVIAATTAAALDHRISPISAFIPWIIWYVLGTVSDIVMMVPTVYRRTHAPGFPGDAAGSAATTNSPQDPFLPGGPHRNTGTGTTAHTSTSGGGGSGGGAGVPTPSSTTPGSRSGGDEDGAGSDNASFVVTPWRTRQYWRDLAELVVEAVCVYAFMALAFQRALQQQQSEKGSVLSFWVIFTPLFVFFGLHLVANTWEGYFGAVTSSDGSTTPSTPLNTAAAFRADAHLNNDTRGPAGSPASGTHTHRPSCGERMANVLLRTFPSACGVYMCAMWAAKSEYEYNGIHDGADPSAFIAFLPILVVLGALSFFVCCGGCLVVCLGSALTSMGEEGAAAQQQQAQQQPHGQARRSSGLPSSAREEGYRSTAARTPRSHATPSPTAAPSSTARRGGAAKDVAIEQID